MHSSRQFRLSVRRWRGATSNPRLQTCTSRRAFAHTPRLLEASRNGAEENKQNDSDLTKNEQAPLTQEESSSSSSTLPPNNPPRQSRTRSRSPILIHFAALSAVVAGAFYYANETRKSRFLLNDTRFMPCPVLANEPLDDSDNAFILTIQTPMTALVQTAATRTNYDVVDEAFHHGLWSVEVKQPQLQIARNYTPLPPVPSSSSSSLLQLDESNSTQPMKASSSSPLAKEEQQTDPETQRRLRAGLVPLSFYIRRYDSGEVSTYLSRMKPGDLVEIRGPHLGFDLSARLGDVGEKVVFLAGGTGIAPAMQAAAKLLQSGVDDSQSPVESNNNNNNKNKNNDNHVQHVTILWANRFAADCAGCERLKTAATDTSRGFWSWIPGGRRQAPSPPSPSSFQNSDDEPSSAVMHQLRALQRAYAQQGKTLQVQCVVDEEGSRVDAHDIARAVSVHGQAHTQAGAAVAAAATTGRLQINSSTCDLHAQQRLEHATESDDTLVNGDGAKTSNNDLKAKHCNCTGGNGTGKNLFLISGPDGFVSAYVGPKVWTDGAERQGRVGGVVAELMKKDPQLWKDWLVLKQ